MGIIAWFKSWNEGRRRKSVLAVRERARESGHDHPNMTEDEYIQHYSEMEKNLMNMSVSSMLNNPEMMDGLFEIRGGSGAEKPKKTDNDKPADDR